MSLCLSIISRETERSCLGLCVGWVGQKERDRDRNKEKLPKIIFWMGRRVEVKESERVGRER